ncbi:MAG: Ig-like domain-containing protein, partial [Thermoleophilaceae bacterium]
LGRLARTIVVAPLALVLVLVLAAPAGAVLSGFNGRIVFVSGRGGPASNDSEAKVYLRTMLSNTGLGSASGAVTPTTGIQHRHPTWSPDRTKIAYAAGVAPNYDIFVLDLTTPGAIPENITNSPTVPDDRPAWAPDGKHIAYESGVQQGSNQTDIIVQEYPTSGVSPLHLTSTTNAGENEGKPAWSPDSQTIYYAKGPLTGADIEKKPAHGGSETEVLNLATDSAFQPSISPDGTKMCYTHGAGFNGTAEIYVTSISSLPAAEGSDLSDSPGNAGDAAKASYNCTWSPDGQLIAYVEGQLTLGDLVIESSDDSGFPIPIESTSAHFDGNPDWAPDGTPVCKSKTVHTGPGKALTISIECNDTGPAYEQTPVTEHISDPPDHGKLGPVTQGDPSTVTYTPNKGFAGTDKFKFNGIDAVQFAASATVTVKVDDTAPKLTDLKVSPAEWTRSAGTTISFKLSEKAQVTLRFQRAKAGRRVGGKCVKETSANKGSPKCTRYVDAGKRTVAGKKGKNNVKFHGKISKTKVLSPGRYRLKARAKDGAGNRSATKTAKFRILKG